MEWEAAINLTLAVAGLTVGVVVLWGYGHLRLRFDQQMEKQYAHIKRLVETIDKQQGQIEQLHAHVKTLTEQSGKLTRVVSGMVERSGAGAGDETPADQPPPRMLH